MKSKRIVDIVCDSLGSGKTTGGDQRLSFIEVLKEEGIPVRPTTYKEKLDEEFIEKIRTVLAIPETQNNFGNKIPKLRFFSHCIGCISDVENVTWKKIRRQNEYQDRLEIGNKDFLACIKYALATAPSFIKGRAKVYRRKPVSAYGQGRLRG